MNYVIHRILAGLILLGLFSFSAVSFAGTWELKTNMPTGRFALSTSAVDGKIYAIGGQDNTPTVCQMEEYDTVEDKWTEKKKIPTGRFRLASSAVNGKIYAIGGTANNFEALATVEEYDPKTNTWTQKADMPTPRMALATVVVGGKIYAIGGASSFFFPSGAVEVYSPTTDTWTQKADMPNPRWGLAAAAVFSKIYVFGGAVDQTHKTGSKIVEEYDTKTDTWTQKTDLWLDVHGVSASFVNNGKIYVIGGQKWKGKGGVIVEDWGFYPTVAEYDPEKDTFEIKEDMPTAKSYLGASVVDGRIYAIGGWPGGAGGDRDKNEVYTPDGWPFPARFSVSPHGKLATTWVEIKCSQ